MTIVAGAGGHALEVLDVLKEGIENEEFFFFDNTNTALNNFKEYKVLHSKQEITALSNSFEFILAVGNSSLREKMFRELSFIGGKLKAVRSNSAVVSSYAKVEAVDIMKNCFIGPEAELKKGSLINTGAQIHHQAIISEYCEISPRAIILGKAFIGSSTAIGSNATILPNIRIGNNVVVAAGAVVTKNLPDNCMAAGVPAVIRKQFR